MTTPRTDAPLVTDTRVESAAITQTIVPVAFDPERFAGIFYGRLFERAPGLRGLFPSDTQAQGVKLAQTLVLLVSAQAHAEALVPTLRDLGARHRGYGAEPEHYKVAGEVLLETLALMNADAWTAQAHADWSDLHDWVVRQMIAE